MKGQAGQVFLLQLVLLATLLAFGAAAVSAAARLEDQSHLAALSAAAQGLAQAGLAEAVDDLAQGTAPGGPLPLPWSVPRQAVLVASAAPVGNQGDRRCSGGHACTVQIAACASEYAWPASTGRPVSFEIEVELVTGGKQGDQHGDGGSGATVRSFRQWQVPVPAPASDPWCTSGGTEGTAP